MTPEEATLVLQQAVQPLLDEALGYHFDLKRVSYDQTGVYSLMDLVAEVRAALNRMETIVVKIRERMVQIDNALLHAKADAQHALDTKLTSLSALERQNSWETQNATARLAATDKLIIQRRFEMVAAFIHATYDAVQSKTRSLAAVRNDIQLMTDIFRLASLPREVF